MDNVIKKIGFVLFGGAIAIGGLQILIYGSFQRIGISNGVYHFDGLERLIGLIPIVFGMLIIYMILKTEDLKD